MPIYMKFEGIDGEVTAKGWEKYIELQSFQFGVGRSVSSSTGRGSSRESSAPTISEITVTKNYDVASSKLFKDSVAGELGAKVEIKFATTTKNQLETYLAFELTRCGVSSYSVSSGGDKPMESLSLNFTKIMISPTPLTDAGKQGKGAVVSYDLELAKAS